MYLSHYNLKEKPFQLSPDPKFLWLGEDHKEALATLQYGLLTNKGFILLTGDVGTGKTTLINSLIDRSSDNIVIASVFDPQMESLDFYNFIAYSFKMNMKFKSKGDFLVKFTHLLYNTLENKKKLLLIIDESQRLTNELLEEIRHLSNIELQNKKLLSIILSGQNELNNILNENINRPIRQRISTNYNLKPLGANDIREYIRHRLQIAGTQRKIFKASALPQIMSFSKGYPRLINSICDHALLTGYVKGVKKIDAKIIKECSRELLLPNEQEQLSPERSKQVVGGKDERRYLRKTISYAVLCLLLIVFGYFLHSRSDILIRNKRPQLITESQMVKAEINMDRQAQNRGERANLKIRAEDGTELRDRVLSEGEKLESNAGPVKERLELNKNVAVTVGEDDYQRTHMVKAKGFPSLQNYKIIIYFGFNSSELPNDAYEKLEQLTAAMTRDPEIRIVIRGYTDKSGIYSYNKMLSESRANVVKSYLIGKSIEPARIKTLGLGPVDSSGTNDAARSARRVEIESDKNI